MDDKTFRGRVALPEGMDADEFQDRLAAALKPGCPDYQVAIDAKFGKGVATFEPAPVSMTEAALRLQSDSLRYRMGIAIDALSAIQARDVLQAHGHDDLHQHLETALGALIGRKE